MVDQSFGREKELKIKIPTICRVNQGVFNVNKHSPVQNQDRFFVTWKKNLF
jgi:hypothetical protein